MGIIKIDIRLFNHRLSFGLYSLGDVRTVGVHNRIKHSPYRVLFLDYDYYKQEWVEEEINFFIEKFKLGNFILLKTSEKGFHAICFDIITSQMEQEILDLSGCDAFFKSSHQWDFRSRVLRITEKGKTPMPEFVRMIRSPYNNKRTKSGGHYKLYKKIFKLDSLFINKKLLFKTKIIPFNKKEQTIYEVSLIGYPTKNNI